MGHDYIDNDRLLNFENAKNLAATVEDTPQYLAFFNPDNPEHRQTNFCCRLRLEKEQDIDAVISGMEQKYRKENLIPRFFIDERATPSMAAFEAHFKALGSSYTIEHDTDIIMRWKAKEDSATAYVKNMDATNVSIKHATMNDLDALTDIFTASFNYGDENEWLRIKLAKQLSMPDEYKATMAVLKLDDGRHVATSAAILYLPRDNQDLGLVQVVGSDPKYQRFGLAAACTVQVLQDFAGGRDIYLEVYEEISHAQRMYQRLGFEVRGTFKFFQAHGVQTAHLI
jgi:ribosomal protein S18 acetylase RimI-like enzyme